MQIVQQQARKARKDQLDQKARKDHLGLQARSDPKEQVGKVGQQALLVLPVQRDQQVLPGPLEPVNLLR